MAFVAGTGEHEKFAQNAGMLYINCLKLTVFFSNDMGQCIETIYFGVDIPKSRVECIDDTESVRLSNMHIC
jgi:hypothetical protein